MCNITKILQLYFRHSKSYPNKTVFNWTRSNLEGLLLCTRFLKIDPNCTPNIPYSHMITLTHILHECYTDEQIKWVHITHKCLIVMISLQ